MLVLIFQNELETKCPDIMKLGLLHQVDTTKIHLKGHTSFVSFEHKSLQELAAALYICYVLEHGDDIQVSVNEYVIYLSVARKNIYYKYILKREHMRFLFASP